MTDEKSNNGFAIFLCVLTTFTIIFLIIESCIAIYAFTHADSVTCNLLYCEAKTEYKIVKQECYSNGVMVNCSSIPAYSKNGIYANENDCFINHKQVDCKTFIDKYGADEHFCNNGVCEMNGV